MSMHQASSCRRLFVPDALAGLRVAQVSITCGRLARLPLRCAFGSIRRLFAGPSLACFVVATSLALAAPGGHAYATDLQQAAQIEDNTKSAVSGLAPQLGIEDAELYDIHSVSLPRSGGPSGIAACGTVQDLTEKGLSFHFIAFYERDSQGQAVLVGSPMFVWAGLPGFATAAELCGAAAATAHGRAWQQGAGPRT